MENFQALVIDLFAGPGGLGEGISSCTNSDGYHPFKIGVSVEKEPSAHRTLTTRSFFRKIAAIPEARRDYYEYLHGNLSRKQLFEKHKQFSNEALNETLEQPRALGEDNKLIHSRIKKLIKNHKGPRVVIGGPPCQAYSLAGRSRNAGNKDYIAEQDSRHFLYKEYLQVISIAQPEVFVMENVRGILSAKINDKLMFPEILKDLRSPNRVTGVKSKKGYKVYSLVVDAETPDSPSYKDTSDYLIKSELFGVPQNRHRVILLGVREDIKKVPGTLNTYSNDSLTVKNILHDLPRLRSGFSKQQDITKDWAKVITSHASQLQRILKELYSYEKLNEINLLPYVDLPRSDKIHSDIESSTIPSPLSEWLLDLELGCVLNHETRGHIKSDLLRYAFCAVHSQLNNGVSPKSRDFPKKLAPAHANWETGKHADRFRVQSANKTATTITSHISKDGHYFIHYDPKQCRSLTVREAARLQTFPDNYFFEGTRTQQYVQVGNAVPPYLAKQIGDIVMKLLFK